MAEFAEDQPFEGEAITHCGHISVAKYWCKVPGGFDYIRNDGTSGRSIWITACEMCYKKAGEDWSRMPIMGDCVHRSNLPIILKPEVEDVSDTKKDPEAEENGRVSELIDELRPWGFSLSEDRLVVGSNDENELFALFVDEFSGAVVAEEFNETDLGRSARGVRSYGISSEVLDAIFSNRKVDEDDVE